MTRCRLALLPAAAGALMLAAGPAAAQTPMNNLVVGGDVAITEAADTNSRTITVRLGNRPAGDVTVIVSSHDTSRATVSPALLTFTGGNGGNWDVEQPVTVTAVDDRIDQGDAHTVTVTFTARGGGYNASEDRTATIADNDTRGFLTDVSTLVLEETGSAFYGIKLASQPTGDVTVTPDVPASGVIRIMPATLAFTKNNWDDFQRVTVSGENNHVPDPGGRRTATISHQGAGGDYDGTSGGDIDVTVNDDDRKVLASRGSVTVTEASGSGRTATYTLVLNARPDGNVTVTATSRDTGRATVMPASLTFTPSNWHTARTVTVRAVDDGKDEDRGTSIRHAATGGGFDGVNAPSVSVTVTDDDTRGVTVQFANSLLQVGEDGGTFEYRIRLDTEPVGGDVTIEPMSGDTSIVTVMPASLTFTAGNWNTDQLVTITGVNDDIVNPADRIATITHDVSGADYGSVTAADVRAHATDDDTRGVTFSRSAVTVDEDAGTATYTAVLTSQPVGGDVTVTPMSSDTVIATVSGALTFTTDNWNTPRTVTVTGVNDDVDNAGDRRTTMITHAVSGADYGTVTPSNVGVTATDDDTRGIMITAPRGGVMRDEVEGPMIPRGEVRVVEDGGTATYTVALMSQPDGVDVTVTPASSATAIATVSGALTFTAGNWQTAQTVTVTGVNDDVDNAGDRRTTMITHATTGGDYGGMMASVSVTATDDDTAGMSAALPGGATRLEVPEAGPAGTYTLHLDSEPTADVTVMLTSSSTGDGAPMVSPLSLTFTADNWQSARTVTVTAVNNDDVNVAFGPETRGTTISHMVSSSAAEYGNVMLADLEVDVIDDEQSRTVGVANVLVSEGEEPVEFVIRMTGHFPQDITVDWTVTDGTATTPDDYDRAGGLSGTVTFPAGTMDMLEQPVTVETFTDGIAEGDETFSLELSGLTASGGSRHVTIDDALRMATATIVDNAETAALARRGRLNEQILPRVARAMAASALAAVTGRIDAVASGAGGASTLAGETNILQVLKSGERSMENGTPDLERMLGDATFVLPLNAAGAGGAGAPGSVAVWGSGDYRFLEGADDSTVDWDGGLFSVHLGADMRLEPDVLAGLSVSRSEGAFDYEDRTDPITAEGRYASRMISVHPYANWFVPGSDLGLWATAGYGRGEVEIEDAAAGRDSSDTTLVTAAVGGTARLLTDNDDEVIEGGVTELDLKGEGSVAQVEVRGTERIDPLTSDVGRLRLLLEARHVQELEEGTSLVPSLEFGVRYDTGDVAKGAGVEIGGGLRYLDPAMGLTVEGHGRALVAHRSDIREWGLGGLVRLDPVADGSGLLLSLAPGWGGEAGNVGDLYDRHVAGERVNGSDERPAGRLEAELAWGLPDVVIGGMVIPFAGVTLTDGQSRRYRLGGRLDVPGSALGMSIEGERREGAAAVPDHGVMLRLRAAW